MGTSKFNAMSKAARLGGYAGRPETSGLWDLSKRELVEIALRLGEICADADEITVDDAIARVWEERRILKANGII